MTCTNCGTMLEDTAAACVTCGQPTVAQAMAQPAAPMYPSVAYLVCPSCNGNDLHTIGQKGGNGKAIGMAFAFGAIGSMVAGASAADDTTTYPIQYKCKSCKNKFESGPLIATPGEILAAPCTINFTRKGSFVGMAVPQIVYLNGMKMGPVKNGKTITFQTMVRHNNIFVSDQFGVAFKTSYRFDAPDGGVVDVKFKRKFVQ